MKTNFVWPDPGGHSLSALELAPAGCNEGKADPKAEAPPPQPSSLIWTPTTSRWTTPNSFPLVTAIEHKAAPALNVTGVVQPDIARAVPVISLASGRVVEIKARLGDVVKKGQLLLKVRSNDVSGAYQTYLKAVNDERLARQQLSGPRFSTTRVRSPRARLNKPKTPNRMPRPTWMPQPNSCGFSASTRTIHRGSSTSSRPYRG